MLVVGEGSENGSRYDSLRGFAIAVAYFEFATDSELVFVGDAGTNEPSNTTRRLGVEVNSFWEISHKLVFDCTAAKTDGHVHGQPKDTDSIPDAHGLACTRWATAPAV